LIVNYPRKDYERNTPTQGCLCALESWDENTGQRILSDQQILVDRFNRLKE